MIRMPFINARANPEICSLTASTSYAANQSKLENSTIILLLLSNQSTFHLNTYSYEEVILMSRHNEDRRSRGRHEDRRSRGRRSEGRRDDRWFDRWFDSWFDRHDDRRDRRRSRGRRRSERRRRS
jgi:hypothetical protein